MRAVRPATVALFSLVAVLLLVPRPAVAGVPALPALPAPTVSAPPRATSLPGAENAGQDDVDDVLASAAIVLVSGVVGIAALMLSRS